MSAHHASSFPGAHSPQLQKRDVMNIYDITAEVNARYTRNGGFTIRRRATQFVTLHYAAANYPSSSGKDDVMAIAKFHTDLPPNGNGWEGIGYHAVLAEEWNGGPVALYIVSDPNLQRAHVFAMNDVAWGVCCATTFPGTPSQKWLDAIGEALLYGKLMYPGATIVGHNDIAIAGHKTSCPGPTWPTWKPLAIESYRRAAAAHDAAQTATANPQVIGVRPSISLAQWQAALTRHSAPLSVEEMRRAYEMCE